jgi:hypothetical protein
MALSSETLPQKPRSFDAPQEPQWHREDSLGDWLAAEQQVRQVISPILDYEATMNDTTSRNQPKRDIKTLVNVTEQRQGVSRFEKFASTQAGGDGIEGDVLKPNKTVDEKLGANMPDRK